jgi:hypothetical protein
VSFAAITLCIASQRVFIVVVYFVIDSVRKLLDTPEPNKLRYQNTRENASVMSAPIRILIKAGIAQSVS